MSETSYFKACNCTAENAVKPISSGRPV